MNNGWIKVHRSLKNHWIRNNSEYYAAFIDLLMFVNHSEIKVNISSEIIICKRGQSLKSLNTWATFFGKWWTIQKVRTFFKLLEKDGMIKIEGLRKTTRLTVCNYYAYQDVQQTTNRQLTDKQQTTNRQLTTNKNDKNEKNEKNDKNEIEDVVDIVNDLNTVLGATYKSKTKMTTDLILARIKEGHTFEDFQKVHRKMFKLWSNDKEMCKYLRPSTLYRQSKFEGYLNIKELTENKSIRI